MEIMEATPDSVQVEIVSSLPEIIPDAFHDLVAQGPDHDILTGYQMTNLVLNF